MGEPSLSGLIDRFLHDKHLISDRTGAARKD
jgi:hypothetical protein